MDPHDINLFWLPYPTIETAEMKYNFNRTENSNHPPNRYIETKDNLNGTTNPNYLPIEYPSIQYIETKQKPNPITVERGLEGDIPMLYFDTIYPTNLDARPKRIVLQMHRACIAIHSQGVTIENGFIYTFAQKQSTLYIWNPYYTENMVMNRDGSSEQFGYNMRTYNKDILIVKEKTSIMELNCDFSNVENITIEGDNCTIHLAKVFKDNNVKLDGLDYNTIVCV